jgi:hypothetical protein
MGAHKHPPAIVSAALDAYMARLTLAGYRPRTLQARRGCLAMSARTICVTRKGPPRDDCSGEALVSYRCRTSSYYFDTDRGRS